MANTTAGHLLNSTRILTETPQIEKIDQCDYTLLFSHLHSQIRTAHQDILQNVYHSQEFQFEEEATYKLAVTSACVLFGLFFAICGYRCLKLSTFLVGFSLGAGIIYLILNEQKQLSNVENLIISVSIGVLFAFVALLVQYIGLFLIGITSSVSIVTCILILIDLFYTNQSAWVCIGLLFVCATVVASFTLKFQKSLTIVNTSIIGSALLFVAVDFVVENNLLMDYIFELFKVNGHIFNIYERQKALLHKSGSLPEISTTIASVLVSSATRAKSATTTTLPLVVENPFGASTNGTSAALALFLRLYSSANAKLCWYTWGVFGSFFVILFFSLIIQFLCTGRRHDHRESWQKLIRGNRKRKTANLEKIRLKSHHSDSESQHRHLTKSQHKSHRHNQHQTPKDYSNSNSLSSSQIDLVAATNQTDTLRLVESGQSQLSYTGSSASDDSSTRALNHSKHKKKQRTEDDFEIVSFEIIKSKSKSRNEPKQPTKTKLTSATTASTSSTSSTGSSTCQLIPMKLNNGSCGTGSTTVGVPNCPSPKATSTITTAHHTGTMLPPPVPTLPPPKLPENLSTTLASNSNRTDTINSAVSLSNSILVPNQLFLPKLKSHRHTGTTSSKKSGDKAETSEHKFRQLYQIRRNNGDVLSQDFLKNFQAKQASSNQLNSSTIDSSFIDTNTFELRSSSLSAGDKKKVAKSQEKSKQKK